MHADLAHDKPPVHLRSPYTLQCTLEIADSLSPPLRKYMAEKKRMINSLLILRKQGYRKPFDFSECECNLCAVKLHSLGHTKILRKE